MKTLYAKLFAPTDRGFYLAVYRIALAALVIFKILNAWPYLDLLYSHNTFVRWAEADSLGRTDLLFVQTHYLAFHALYLVLAVFMALGIGKQTTVAGIFVLTHVMQSINGWILDGGDNLLKFQLFYLIFCNSFQHLCLRKQPLSGSLLGQFSVLFTNLGVASIIMHLLLVYFISGISKLHADVWYNGIALYYAFAGDRFRGSDLNLQLVQNPVLVTLATYGTMLWETFIPVLVWFRRLRLPLLAMGVAMHLSIIYFMMIQEFQFLFIFTYGFFFSDAEWARFRNVSGRRFHALVKWLQMWKPARA